MTSFAAIIVATLIAQSPTPDAQLDRALQALGLQSGDIAIKLSDLNTFDHQPKRLPIVEWAMTQPLKTPILADYIAATFNLQSTADAVNGITQLSRWLGATVRRGLIGDPLEQAKTFAKQPDCLPTVIERIHRLGGQQLNKMQSAAIKAKCAALPDNAAQALALLLYVIADAQEWADLAFKSRTDEQWLRVLTFLRKPTVENTADEGPLPISEYPQFRDATNAATSFDPRLLFIGAEEIVFAVDYTKPVFDRLAKSNRRLDFQLNTPLGTIAVTHRHRPDRSGLAPLLLIDLSGKDEHSALAFNSAPTQRVSVAIDLSGDDSYSAPADSHGSFGAGQLGMGLLFDFGGDDTYQATRYSQASALFGFGLLYDAAGDDHYFVKEQGQGAAQAGAALLIDCAGTDTYEVYTTGQGFGGPAGAGLLADLDGNDRYIANDTDIIFPSSQSAEHNNSVAQGAGLGIRGDYREGLSAPGGIGVLYDAAGDDEYSAAVFAQGVGYWFGMGALIDRSGNDTYKGMWYVQGASAHFAVGLLFDKEGDDHYTATMAMAQGAGHDIGIGVLADDAGNDIHDAPSLGLGAGNAGGLGLFIDRGGDDTYNVTASNTLGWATVNSAHTLRAAIPAIGIFLDLGGHDTYPEGRGGDGTQWGQTPDPPSGVLRGIAHAIDLD